MTNDYKFQPLTHQFHGKGLFENDLTRSHVARIFSQRGQGIPQRGHELSLLSAHSAAGALRRPPRSHYTMTHYLYVPRYLIRMYVILADCEIFRPIFQYRILKPKSSNFGAETNSKQKVCIKLYNLQFTIFKVENSADLIRFNTIRS